MVADFTSSDTRQDTGISGCRNDLTRGGDVRLAPDQPLRSLKAAVRGASTRASSRAYLHGVARSTGIELDQLRCQNEPTMECAKNDCFGE